MGGSPRGLKCTVLRGRKREAKSGSDCGSMAFYGLLTVAGSSTSLPTTQTHHAPTITSQPFQIKTLPGHTDPNGKVGSKEARKEGQNKKGKGNLCLKHQVHYAAITSCVTGPGRSLCLTNLDLVNENYFLFAKPIPHVVF